MFRQTILSECRSSQILYFFPLLKGLHCKNPRPPHMAFCNPIRRHNRQKWTKTSSDWQSQFRDQHNHLYNICLSASNSTALFFTSLCSGFLSRCRQVCRLVSQDQLSHALQTGSHSAYLTRAKISCLGQHPSRQLLLAAVLTPKKKTG
jgi:hypothetical protein